MLYLYMLCGTNTIIHPSKPTTKTRKQKLYDDKKQEKPQVEVILPRNYTISWQQYCSYREYDSSWASSMHKCMVVSCVHIKHNIKYRVVEKKTQTKWKNVFFVFVLLVVFLLVNRTNMCVFRAAVTIRM